MGNRVMTYVGWYDLFRGGRGIWEESPESQAGVHYVFPRRLGNSGKLPNPLPRRQALGLAGRRNLRGKNARGSKDRSCLTGVRHLSHAGAVFGEVPPATRGGGLSHPPAPSTRRHHRPPKRRKLVRGLYLPGQGKTFICGPKS